MTADVLIVFIRNPVPGKVKTRLAAEIGENKANRVYLQLLNRTFKLCAARHEDITIYFSDFIDRSLSPDMMGAQLYIQKGKHLGVRMYAAIDEQLLNHKKVVLIGSDCPGLSHSILDKAFKSLERSDIAIGPAEDGGYYLIGMKEPVHTCFENISWGSNQVLGQTMKSMEHAQKTCSLLPELRDLDTLDDLEYFESIGII